ncbi:DNA primase, partial [bacterium]|nr:DNA primase [bacterium]
PSFVVSPQKQIYHCFGCGAGGDVFSFLTKIDNISFIDVLEKLSKKANIDIPHNLSFQSEKSTQERKALYDLHEKAMDFYNNFLLQEEESVLARKYLQTRGICSTIINKFKIGYASKRGDVLLKKFLNKGFSLDLLKKSGLICFSEKKRKFLDFFWNRIVFPICDSQGRIVAFGGRVLDSSLPKYINSSETMIYNKRKILYGLNFASAKIRELKQVLILEGYIDMLTSYQYGLENVVATLGTALTKEHISILQRYTEEVVIVYDSDKAGISAALRGIEQLVDSGLRIKIVTLPQGMDPDSCLRKKGKKIFDDFLKNGLSFIDYQFKIVSNNMDFSKVENKIYIANNILPMIARIRNEIERREEIRKFAEKMSLPEESLLSELNKIKKGNKIKVKKEAFFLDNKEKKEPLIEMDLLHILLTEPVYIQRVKKKICVDDFTGEVTSRLIKYVFESEEEGREVSFHRVMDYFHDEKINQIVTQMILNEAIMSENKNDILEKLLENMCRCKITKRRNKLEKEIKAMLNGEKKKDLTKLREYNDLTRQLKGSQQQLHIL